MALPIGGKFLRHRNSDVRRWARSLDHIRFCHPADTQVYDREVFEASVAVPDIEEALVQFCAGLGIMLRRIQPEDKVARAGTKYTPQEWKELKFSIPEFPNLVQPKEQTVAGVSVHFWIRRGFLEITISPPPEHVSVDESDFQRAKAMDDVLKGHRLTFRDPARDDDSCVCPKYYPEFWK
jgi:hypothetical protein